MSSFIYPPSSYLSKQVKLVKFASQMINREEMWCLGKTFSQEGCDNVTFSFLNYGESSEGLRCWYCCVISSWLEPSEECIFVCPEAISGMKVMQKRFFILPSSEGLACSVGVGDVRRSWFCSVEMWICWSIEGETLTTYELEAPSNQSIFEKKVANRSHVSGNSCRLLVVS